ncbi:MAG: hypothetical protein KDB25_09280 [Leucobacter sp.]|nr:hypothetical protein [Leucobacter sp.]
MLFPALAARLDAALDAHLERAGSGGGSAGGTVASFDAHLDAAASARFSGAGFGSLLGTSAGDRFARAFAAARTVADELFAGDAGAVPEPEAFAAAGSDLARLAEQLDADPDLVPVPAPYGLGLPAWQRACARAATLAGSPFRGAVRRVAAGDGVADSEEDPPLVLGAEVSEGFAHLDRAPSGSALVPGRPSWALRLVPAAAEPRRLGLNFAQSGPHATLPELLMLQLMRAVRGEAPLDGGDGRSSFTWIDGELAGGRLAARHVFDAGTIRITAREVGNQGPHLGSRPPIG